MLFFCGLNCNRIQNEREEKNRGSIRLHNSTHFFRFTFDFSFFWEKFHVFFNHIFVCMHESKYNQYLYRKFLLVTNRLDFLIEKKRSTKHATKASMHSNWTKFQFNFSFYIYFNLDWIVDNKIITNFICLASAWIAWWFDFSYSCFIFLQLYRWLLCNFLDAHVTRRHTA